MRARDQVLQAFEGVWIALDAIRANKVRAALTIMGVAVGVFVVVAMGATVHGIRQSFQKDMDEFGTATFQVRRRNPGFNACNPTTDNCPERRFPGVSLAEWRAIQRLPEVDQAMAWLPGGGATLTYRDRIVKNVGYDAQSTEWINTNQADIAPGRTFTETEHDAAATVAIVNRKLAGELFGDSDPLGKEIDLDGTRFTVIGVFETKAGFLKSLDGRGPDTPRLIIPMMTAWRRLDVWRRRGADDARLHREAHEVLAELHGRDAWGLYRPEALQICASALRLFNVEAARAATAEARRWIETALHRVPAPFRDSFLQRNAVNVQVLAAPR